MASFLTEKVSSSGNSLLSFFYRHIQVLGKIQYMTPSLIVSSQKQFLARLDPLTGAILWRKWFTSDETLYSIKEKENRLATLSFSANQSIYYVRLWDTTSGALQKQWYHRDRTPPSLVNDCQLIEWLNTTLVYAIHGHLRGISIQENDEKENYHVSLWFSHPGEILHIQSMGTTLIVTLQENNIIQQCILQNGIETQPICCCKTSLQSISNSNNIMLDGILAILQETAVVIIHLASTQKTILTLPENEVTTTTLSRIGPTTLLLHIERKDDSLGIYTLDVADPTILSWKAHKTYHSVLFLRDEKELSFFPINNTSIRIEKVR
jgi:hypothetical protein